VSGSRRSNQDIVKGRIDDISDIIMRVLACILLAFLGFEPGTADGRLLGGCVPLFERFRAGGREVIPSLVMSPTGAPKEVPKGQKVSDRRGTGAEVIIRIDGMKCGGCSGRLMGVLRSTHGVVDVDVNLLGAYASVQYLPNLTSLELILETIRRETVFVPTISGFGKVLDNLRATQRKAIEKRERLSQGVLKAFAFVVPIAIIMGLPQIASIIGAKMCAACVAILSTLAHVDAYPLIHESTVRSLGKALRSMFLHPPTLGMDFLTSSGSLISLLCGWITLQARGSGHCSSGHHFSASNMIVFASLLGRWLESKASGEVANLLGGVASLLPLSARRLNEKGDSEIVPTDVLLPGDIVQLIKGDKIPGDGHIHDGEIRVDECVITGESLTIKVKSLRDPVQAGTEVISGSASLVLSHCGMDTGDLTASAFLDIFRLIIHFVFIISIVDASRGSCACSDRQDCNAGDNVGCEGRY
jgi:copper chaperone CopZ